VRPRLVVCQLRQALCTDAHVVDFEIVKLRGESAKYEIEAWMKVKEADNLVLARRGDSERPADNIGSTTDYCVANVLSNVIVIK
jgi:hypothetical protein